MIPMGEGWDTGTGAGSSGGTSSIRELTSRCPNQPCLSLANHRTFAWRQWQLRVTGGSVVCGFAGPLEVGSHTAAARPVERGMWLRELSMWSRGPTCLSTVPGKCPWLNEKYDGLPFWFCQELSG